MNFILVTIVLVALACFVLLQISPFISNSNTISDPDIPVTWNLDWQGGPGFDRFKILNEKGPYNPRGFT